MRFQIKAKDVPPEGVVLAGALDRAWVAEHLPELETQLAEIIPTTYESLDAKISLTWQGRDLQTEGALSGQLEVPCVRCLRPAHVDISGTFFITYGADVEEGQEAGLDPDVDLRPLPPLDVELDLDDVLREQILLALPMTPLCAEDCKGLCGQCGANKNETNCGCRVEFVDPRLAALRDVKLGN